VWVSPNEAATFEKPRWPSSHDRAFSFTGITGTGAVSSRCIPNKEGDVDRWSLQTILMGWKYLVLERGDLDWEKAILLTGLCKRNITKDSNRILLLNSPMESIQSTWVNRSFTEQLRILLLNGHHSVTPSILCYSQDVKTSSNFTINDPTNLHLLRGSLFTSSIRRLSIQSFKRA